MIFSEGAKNCIIPINAAENPASIIPIIIKDVVEFNLDEKKTIMSNANIAPENDARQMIHELFIQEPNPNTEARKITIATPNPEADVMPKTDGSANGFLNSSCNNNPLMGNAIPASRAAMVLGNL